MEDKFNLRTITHSGNVYIRKEDVAAMIRECAAVEEADVGDRFGKLADNIMLLRAKHETKISKVD